jgi:hypothetical protein
MKCRRCGLEVECEGFQEIAEIQGYQCPGAIPGVGHWMRAIR